MRQVRSVYFCPDPEFYCHDSFSGRFARVCLKRHAQQWILQGGEFVSEGDSCVNFGCLLVEISTDPRIVDPSVRSGLQFHVPIESPELVGTAKQTFSAGVVYCLPRQQLLLGFRLRRDL
jgi:hypothetical protein